MLVLMGYRTVIARYVAKWVSHRCACLKLSTKAGGIAPFWRTANFTEKASRDIRYRSDSIAASRDTGPLSSTWQRTNWEHSKDRWTYKEYCKIATLAWMVRDDLEDIKRTEGLNWIFPSFLGTWSEFRAKRGHGRLSLWVMDVHILLNVGMPTWHPHPKNPSWPLPFPSVFVLFLFGRLRLRGFAAPCCLHTA